MLLYYATDQESLEGVCDCSQKVCRIKGITTRHLCFATEPLPGNGQWVFCIDIPEKEISRFQYENEFREGSSRFYAIPFDLIKKYPPERKEFERITGNPWTDLMVTVYDARPQAHRLSEWAVIWISRRGVATAEVSEKSETVLNFEVKLTRDFDPKMDYVVIERHEESQTAGPKPKETWQLKLLAGTIPQWVLYPAEWRDWVWNKAVTDSAVQFILHTAPELQEYVQYALSRDTKINKSRAWEEVGRKMGESLSRKYDATISLGDLRAHSWTAVAAMPHRIAMRASEQIPFPEEHWKPPVPKPIYANPETSGRIVLANQFGAYPQRGPGVDHRPQDRARTGREGDQGGKRRPFGEPALI